MRLIICHPQIMAIALRMVSWNSPAPVPAVPKRWWIEAFLPSELTRRVLLRETPLHPGRPCVGRHPAGPGFTGRPDQADNTRPRGMPISSGCLFARQQRQMPEEKESQKYTMSSIQQRVSPPWGRRPAWGRTPLPFGTPVAGPKSHRQIIGKKFQGPVVCPTVHSPWWPAPIY